MASVVVAKNRLKYISLVLENYIETQALKLRFGYEKLNEILKTFYTMGNRFLHAG
jgi:hypothetical protein